jgi:hypothetical protein
MVIRGWGPALDNGTSVVEAGGARGTRLDRAFQLIGGPRDEVATDTWGWWAHVADAWA